MKYVKSLMPYVIVIVLVVLLRAFIVTPIIVDGDSMNDTLYDGEIMLLNKLDKVSRYDIVVVKTNNGRIIKRVIGIPGDRIKCVNHVLYINNEEAMYQNDLTDDFEEVFLGDDKYFILGDNRGISFDSRYFGPVDKNDILGTTNFVLFPFKNFGKVN